MNRDELITRLAMELAEWPGGTALEWPDYVAKGWVEVGSMLAPTGDEHGACITKQNYLAERERLINKPSWERVLSAAPWAGYLVQTGDGWWHAFDAYPRIYRATWLMGEAGKISQGICKGALPAGHDWRNTLEQRPVTQTADPVAEDDKFRQCEQRLREAELLRHITPAELVNRQLVQRCEELQESNARLADENQRLRRTIGELCA